MSKQHVESQGHFFHLQHFERALLIDKVLHVPRCHNPSKSHSMVDEGPLAQLQKRFSFWRPKLLYKLWRALSALGCWAFRVQGLRYLCARQTRCKAWSYGCCAGNVQGTRKRLSCWPRDSLDFLKLGRLTPFLTPKEHNSLSCPCRAIC